MRFATQAIRIAQDPDSTYKAVINPIWQSATFAWDSLDDIPQFDYTRVANPNRDSLEQVIAALEGGSFCTVFGSGMAAIAAATSLLEAGDHVLVASDIYGGTHRLCAKQLPRQGVDVQFFDSAHPESLRTVVRPNTRMVIYETPSNPNLRVCDIERVAKIARELGLITVFDNTFASPALQQPLALGVDIVVHSTTKYISGHSDVIGGALVTRDEAIAAHVFEWSKTVGAVPSPFDCWLTLRGLKTLEVRMERHCRNALAVARYLESHPKVDTVSYPGLASHPDHAIAAKQMTAFGGMIAFTVAGTDEDARRVAEATRVFLLAESLGGVESLIGYPPLMSHATLTEAERLERGIPPTMLRLSVGIEDPQDLIDDLEQAFALVGAEASVPELVLAATRR
ncbi:MAG TPA: PLP-dependent aspartate aminotransferase family protein [Fimbriimonadaceae bacterium]|nr:PLP-dependent aspartate aminotransferase family protein [Fimbriimonadaceae bacterium]